MKRLFLSLFAICALVSCSRDYAADIADLQNQIDNLSGNVAALEKVTTN